MEKISSTIAKNIKKVSLIFQNTDSYTWPSVSHDQTNLSNKYELGRQVKWICNNTKNNLNLLMK